MTNPFEAAMADMLRTYRKKRRDYALDGTWDSNFVNTSLMLGVPGFSRIESGYFNILQKIARLHSLRVNGRMNDPANESVLDTYEDLAVYAVIVLAMARADAAADD